MIFVGTTVCFYNSSFKRHELFGAHSLPRRASFPQERAVGACDVWLSNYLLDKVFLVAQCALGSFKHVTPREHFGHISHMLTMQHQIKNTSYTYRLILIMSQYAICSSKREAICECTTVLISWIYTCQMWEEVKDLMLFIFYISKMITNHFSAPSF